MWHYQGQELTDIPDKAISFVYLITHIESGRMYVGKKGFWSTKTKVVKVKDKPDKKKKVKTESDWPKYYGSNDDLKDAIKLHGKDAFRRDILHICYSLSEASYLELREQMDRRVLESDDYWNHWIMFRGRKDHIKSLQKVVA